METWKDIIGYEGLYQISNFGRIKSLARRIDNGYNRRRSLEKLLRIFQDEVGYKTVYLSKNTITKKFRIHRLIAMAFIDNPNNLPQVNHINGIKTDNRIENLEWCTASYNCQHACKTKLKKDKLSLNDIKKIKEIYSTSKPTFKKIANDFNVCPATIHNIISGKRWGWL